VLLLLAGGGIFLGSKLLSNKGNTVETDTISADVNLASLASTPVGAEAMPTPEADERMQPADATPTSDNIPNGSEVRDTPPTQPANTATGKPQNATKDNPDQLRRAEEIETPPAPRPEDNKVFDVVEVSPKFTQGDIRVWLAQNLKYPVLAEENGIQGRVIVSFVIEKNGSISNVQVLRSPDPSLASEAVRVVKSMPRWTPGRQNGKPVRVKYSVPVNFRLQ
jgi:protein TonB